MEAPSLYYLANKTHLFSVFCLLNNTTRWLPYRLRKETVNFVMSVSPSVREEQLVPFWKYFHEIWYFITFRKSVEKINVSLKSDKNKGHFT